MIDLDRMTAEIAADPHIYGPRHRTPFLLRLVGNLPVRRRVYDEHFRFLGWQYSED